MRKEWFERLPSRSGYALISVEKLAFHFGKNYYLNFSKGKTESTLSVEIRETDEKTFYNIYLHTNENFEPDAVERIKELMEDIGEIIEQKVKIASLIGKNEIIVQASISELNALEEEIRKARD